MFDELIWIRNNFGDNSCFSGATTDALSDAICLCIASTTKQQSLHSKQESPPPTHQLGEPPVMADQ